MIEQDKSFWKKALPHVIAVICFIAITMIYFGPLFNGHTLQQSDMRQYFGASQELRHYYDSENLSSAWTGSMFSGMPAYHVAIYGHNINFLNILNNILQNVCGSTAGTLFVAMFCAYLLFIALRFKTPLAALGAVAYGFSSYNLIIISVGHMSKMWAIAYMPIIIAGMLILYRRKLVQGGLMILFGLAMQLNRNHVQITYYTAVLCAFLFIGLLIKYIKEKDYKFLIKTIITLIVVVFIAFLTNANNIYSNYIMAKESQRGNSDLVTTTKTNKADKSPDKKYAFDWSYGKAETWTMLIPNLYGGSSNGILSKSSHLAQQLEKSGNQVADDGIPFNTYWGDQPFTAGPVYFGAIVCFLFLLGMILIRSRIKWVLLIATVFFVFWSWGKNFDTFNSFFFYHFPYYNKFRSVSMALTVPALTMVIIAVWGLKEFFYGKLEEAKRLKALYISGGIVCVISFLLWIVPDLFFSFSNTSAFDMSFKGQYPMFYNALKLDRKDLLSADALRSLLYVLVSAAIMLYCIKSKTKQKGLKTICSIVIALLVLFDLWGIDKRYLNDSNFKDEIAQDNSTLFKKSNADNIILQDKTISYRVLNLGNPFNDAVTSFYHKSIGGYCAVKLKRYQNLIDFRLNNEIELINNQMQHYMQQIQTQMKDKNTATNVTPESVAKILQDSISPYLASATGLNMLNDKYIIYNPDMPPLVNPYAFGNAWFVHNFKIVQTPNDEIAALNNTDLRQTAIVGSDFSNYVAGKTFAEDTNATIVLNSYKPNQLVYKANTNNEQLAVFSEIYFKDGWKAYIDGKQADYIRTDWTLRAIRVPKGQHEIVFKFEPTTYNALVICTTILTGLMLLLLIGIIVLFFVKNLKKKE